MSQTDTVHTRIEHARTDVTLTTAALALALALALGVTLLALQEPLAHESLHNFRHAAGITCH
jgi:uncharacterized membrane protein